MMDSYTSNIKIQQIKTGRNWAKNFRRFRERDRETYELMFFLISRMNKTFR